MCAPLWKATAMLRSGDLMGARALLESMFARRPFDPDLANAVGVLRALTGDYEEARRLFELSLQASRSKAKPLCNLGNLSLIRQDPEGAIRYYIQAMEASFLAPEPRYNAARAYQEMGHFEKALRAFWDYEDCTRFHRRFGLTVLVTTMTAIAYLFVLLTR